MTLMNNNGVALDPSLDGITHINIYSKAKTQLGQCLSFFHGFTFTVPNHGTFASIEGYWYWLATGGQFENFRYVTGLDAKRSGKLLLPAHRVDVPNFDQLIEAAVIARVKADPGLQEAIKQSTLPFTHYYVNDFGQVIPAKTQICVSIYENIRMHLQNI